MSMENNKIKKGYLTFGNFCYLYQDCAKEQSEKNLKTKPANGTVVAEDKNQREIIGCVMDLMHNKKERVDLYYSTYDQPKIISNIFNSKMKLNNMVSNYINQCTDVQIAEIFIHI